MSARLQTLALLLLVVAGTLLRLAQPPVFFRGPDEAVYAHYARTIASQGAAGAAANVREYLTDPQLANFPAPLRLAYIGPLAAVMKFAGDPAGERTGVLLSLAFSALSLATIAFFGLRFFGFWAAAYGLLFLIFSPLDLMLSRRVIQDGGTTLLAGLLLWQSCLVLDRPEKRRHYMLFALVGTLFFFFKESGAAAYAIVFAITLLLLPQAAGRLRLMAWAAALFVPALFLFAHLCGGFGAVLEALATNRRASSGDIMAYFQDGPWYSFVQMQMLLNPLKILFFAVFLFLVGIEARRDPRAAGPRLLPPLFTLLFFAAACAVPHYKNARLLAPLEIPLCLGAGAATAWIAARIGRPLQGRTLLRAGATLIGAAALAAALAKDYDSYDKVFVDAELGEMIVLPRLEELSLYRGPETARDRVAKALAAMVPAGETPLASDAFFDALRAKARPFHRLYRFVAESRWSITTEGHLPVMSPPAEPPADLRYVLYDAMDFYFPLRPDQQRAAASAFFARGGWKPKGFGGTMVLFERGEGGMDELYRAGSEGAELPVPIGAATEHIELRGAGIEAKGDLQESGLIFKFDWRCLKDGGPDHYMAVWLVDGKGKVVLAERRLIAYGLKPTSSWKDGERVVETYRMALPRTLPEEFEIFAGVGLVDTDKLEPFLPSPKVEKNGLAVIGIFKRSPR